MLPSGFLVVQFIYKQTKLMLHKVINSIKPLICVIDRSFFDCLFIIRHDQRQEIIIAIYDNVMYHNSYTVNTDYVHKGASNICNELRNEEI